MRNLTIRRAKRVLVHRVAPSPSCRGAVRSRSRTTLGGLTQSMRWDRCSPVPADPRDVSGTHSLLRAALCRTGVSALLRGRRRMKSLSFTIATFYKPSSLAGHVFDLFRLSAGDPPRLIYPAMPAARPHRANASSLSAALTGTGLQREDDGDYRNTGSQPASPPAYHSTLLGHGPIHQR